MVVRRVRPGAIPQHLLERRWPSVLHIADADEIRMGRQHDGDHFRRLADGRHVC
jgi:hypothetical protein